MGIIAKILFQRVCLRAGTKRTVQIGLSLFPYFDAFREAFRVWD